MQEVKGMPSLPVHRNNRFAILEIKETDKSAGNQVMPTDSLVVESLVKSQIKQWEWNLPWSYMIASISDKSLLQLLEQIQTTDTGEFFGLEALLDCGASGLFINSEYVKTKQINTCQLAQPIPVNNIDGTPNKKGPIWKVVELQLWYNRHHKHAVFAVTCMGKEDLILRLPWVKKHNPEVDWTTEVVKMLQCSSVCSTC